MAPLSKTKHPRLRNFGNEDVRSRYPTRSIPSCGRARKSLLSRKWGLGTVVHFRRCSGGRTMTSSLFYRIAAVLLLLFAVGHTLGFRQPDPSWGVDPLLGSLRSLHFDVQGFSRTYWDFFVAAGLSVGVFYLFAAVLAWQLGGLPAQTLALMPGTAWSFAVCFAAITAVSWRYLFILPIIFSLMITACLIAAAWLSSRTI
jgi:hypothetical protein